MKKSRTGSPSREALASPTVATVQFPLPLLDVLADTRTAFFGLCLEAGEQVLRTMMEHDRERLCGPKNVPNPDRRAYRHGRAPGEVTFGGRRILVPRLRARSVNGHELELPSFAYAAHRDPLDARTLEAIAVGVTTRKYRRALDPLPAGRRERAVSKSSVSRRFVALTSAQLATWLARPLDDLTVRVSVLDEAYGLADATLAKRRLLQLAAALDHTHPGAAASLREGLDETLTLQRLGVTGALYRTLRSTNAIENLNGLVGHFIRHVRRWRNGRMLVRWIAAGLREAARSFRRLRGHHDLAALMRPLDHVTMDSRKAVA